MRGRKRRKRRGEVVEEEKEDEEEEDEEEEDEAEEEEEKGEEEEGKEEEEKGEEKGDKEEERKKGEDSSEIHKSTPEKIQSIPLLPYSSATVERVAERHTFCGNACSDIILCQITFRNYMYNTMYFALL